VRERRVQLGDLSPARPAALPAAAADAQWSVAAPSEADRFRCSNPVIQAGRPHSSRPRSPAARITTPPRRRPGAVRAPQRLPRRMAGQAVPAGSDVPSDSGARLSQRRLRRQSCLPGGVAAGCPRVRPLRAATRAYRTRSQPGLDPSLRLECCIETESGQSGATRSIELQREHAPQVSGPTDLRSRRRARSRLHRSVSSGHASYQRQAPSISTCDSITGGNAPSRPPHETKENARPARIVRGTRAPEADGVSYQPGGGEDLMEDRHQHLHAVRGRGGVPFVRRLASRSPRHRSLCCVLRCGRRITGGERRSRRARLAPRSARSGRCCARRCPTARAASTPP